jgi:hypothetical protein
MRIGKVVLFHGSGLLFLTKCKNLRFHSTVSSESKNIIGIERATITSELIKYGFPKYRANQVWNSIYHKGVHDFDSVSNLPLSLKTFLKEAYFIDYGIIKVSSQYIYIKYIQERLYPTLGRFKNPRRG